MPYRDIEKRRAYGREWMRRNLEEARDAMRRWRERHREVDRQRKRDEYQVNRRRVIERNTAYARAHPEVRLAIRHRRRSHERRGEGFTASAWLSLIAKSGGRCAYCGGAGPLHADHRVPLAGGGTNDIGNILPACARCNLRKHTMSEDAFRELLAFEVKVRVEWVVQFSAKQVRALLAGHRSEDFGT